MQSQNDLEKHRSKDIRLKLSLTQEQFTQSVGVSFSTVNEWENNKRKPSPLALKQIAILIKEAGLSTIFQTFRTIE